METAPVPPFSPRGDKTALEETLAFQPKFDGSGLIPCITQDADTGEILMFAFMNADSLRETLRTGIVHYYSRSRGQLWKKGESSGHTQAVVELRTDCDQDVLLARVRQTGGACHTGYRSCFYRRIAPPETGRPPVLEWAGGEKIFSPEAVYRS